jgi:opacity protein-like surface antigen
MQFKHVRWFLFAVLLLVFGKTGDSQVVPQANAGNGRGFNVGAGLSSYDVDWGHGRMVGGTIWGDWYPKMLTGRLDGLALEVELRDISLDRGTHPSNFRQDTATGGVLYSWPHYNRFRPYGKFLIGLGSIDFMVPAVPNYTHDTRTIFAPGLGIDYRAFGPMWLRVDYEYQDWPQLFGGTLNPQGFTFGATYDFGSGFGR